MNGRFYVYLARVGRTKNVKIGMSEDPVKRLRHLSNVWGKSFTLIDAIGFREYKTASLYEQFLHRRLADYWTGWKWAKTKRYDKYKNFTFYRNGPDGFYEVYSDKVAPLVVSYFKSLKEATA